jgi:hypothetical protein
VLAPDQRKVLGSNPSAPKFASMRDGVTGNTSGFDLEDEGSTPSPAAKHFHGNLRYFDELDHDETPAGEFMLER